MKKITIVLCTLALGATAWISCKKSKNNGPDPIIARGMSAKINGVLWTADLSTMSYFSFGNMVEITGYDSTGKTIDLMITNFKNRGALSLPRADDSASYSTDFGSLASPEHATSGTINIQAVNDTAVGGTFSFSTGSVNVTEGTFYWNYQ